ncbi:MAG: hypothetical protein RL339_1468 [Pseudomonadota bacterium]|jgi:hypothetical protein
MSREPIEHDAGDAPAQPRARRTTTLLVVKGERRNGAQFSLKVRNLSAAGLKGDCPEVIDFTVNEAVQIHFRNLAPIAAEVMWYEGAEVGFKFREPVDLEAISRARSADRASYLRAG